MGRRCQARCRAVRGTGSSTLAGLPRECFRARATEARAGRHAPTRTFVLAVPPESQQDAARCASMTASWARPCHDGRLPWGPVTTRARVERGVRSAARVSDAHDAGPPAPGCPRGRGGGGAGDCPRRLQGSEPGAKGLRGGGTRLGRPRAGLAAASPVPPESCGRAAGAWVHSTEARDHRPDDREARRDAFRPRRNSAREDPE